MHAEPTGLRLSASDLAHFLSCRHLTALDLSVLAHRRTGPERGPDPRLQRLVERGLEHEKAFVQRLRDQGLQVTDLNHLPRGQPERAIEATLDAMRRGDEVIVQAALRLDAWFGYADVLRRMARPSTLGSWSYEVIDTKLARDTRAGTILQLGLYTSIVGSIQGITPEEFHVVVPGDHGEPARQISWRTDDFAAYLRLIQREMLDGLALGDEALAAAFYPEPVEYCGLCRWWRQCDGKRRADDHLSLVANLGRLHRRVLESNGFRTLAALAGMPEDIPFKPGRGSPQTYARARQQAYVQLASRSAARPLHALRHPEAPPPGRRNPPTPPPPQGFARLPAPSPGDLFLDLEGDRGSEESGREYLFGLAWLDAGGNVQYEGRWAFSADEERSAFEATIDRIIAALERDPGMHIYHFAPYEPSAFKRLMGRYATREEALDRLLKGRRFVDLLAVVRQGLFVGVESYSLKELEPCYGFDRQVDLREATECRRRMEGALYLRSPDRVSDEDRRIIEGYNRDDCVSTLRLREWLEVVRLEAQANGIPVDRPVAPDDAASEDRKERDLRVQALRKQLLDGLSDDAEQFVAGDDVPAGDTGAGAAAEAAGPHAEDETDAEDGRMATAASEEHARWVLAYLLDYHRREDKAKWWEYFRLRDMTEDELLDERLAVSKLEFVGRVDEGKAKKGGGFSGPVIDRYRYPEQEMDIERGSTLRTATEGKTFASVDAIDRVGRTIDISKARSRAEIHPSALFAFEYVNVEEIENAIFSFAESVAEAGSLAEAPRSAAAELLLRRPPRLKGSHGRKPATFRMLAGEAELDTAVRVVQSLDHSCLAIQGPPGSGKTYTGAEMICALVKAGKRVGVTANSHKVIRKLLEASLEAASRHRMALRVGHKDRPETDTAAAPGRVHLYGENEAARSAIANLDVQVLGGTAWMWARSDFRNAVDVLFVDEAGQMALATVIAASQAAENLVLLGDPKQLDQPRQGAHPDGVAVSALEHLMGRAPTLPPDRGIFLPTTWRLSPSLCAFTSELYYRNRLTSKAGLERQALVNAGVFTGSGLHVLDVEHEGNRNHAPEEIEAVVRIFGQLTMNGVRWRDEQGKEQQVTVDDILVVAPYNTQVNRLLERLPEAARVGTVDRFQGQEAPVVIYSMATSDPEDAPRGMDFLYSANRLNVATSRARCAVILVANPKLFKPECRTVKQMQLANGLCRFRELASRLEI